MTKFGPSLASHLWDLRYAIDLNAFLDNANPQTFSDITLHNFWSYSCRIWDVNPFFEQLEPALPFFVLLPCHQMKLKFMGNVAPHCHGIGNILRQSKCWWELNKDRWHLVALCWYILYLYEWLLNFLQKAPNPMILVQPKSLRWYDDDKSSTIYLL